MGVHGGYYSSGIKGSTNDVVTTYSSGSEGYRLHTFHQSGVFTVDFDVVVDILSIAGGGGGGKHSGCGGGAGGLVFSQSVYLPAGSYTATIGAGGKGAGVGEASYPTFVGGSGTVGSDTSFYTSTTKGGGFGAWQYSTVGGNGGSGGGGAGGAGRDSGSAVGDQGFDGGEDTQNSNLDPYPAGGGGGAAQKGRQSDNAGNWSGTGGRGSNSFVNGSTHATNLFLSNATTGSTTTATGIGEVSGGLRYIAAGGGGNLQGGGTCGVGGTGGGGDGANNSGNGANGISGSGGGGGGSQYNGTNSGVFGTGGSGIVVIRMGKTQPLHETKGGADYPNDGYTINTAYESNT
jgi:hypothetical protein